MFFLWLNIISGLFIAIIFSLIIIFDRKNMRLELKSIKLISLAALLVALAVILNSFGKLIVSTKLFEIRLGSFILIWIGFFCGGILGFLSGIAADFLGLIYLTGQPVLFYTLTSIIWCILPYYLINFFMHFTTKKWLIYLYLPTVYAYTLLLITAINPIVLKYMYGLDGWWILYFPRIIKFPLQVIINGSLLITVYRFFINSNNLNLKIYQNSNNKKQKTKALKLQLVNNEGATDD